jgi:hypothetical protein
MYMLNNLKHLVVNKPAHLVYKESAKIDGARNIKQVRNLRFVSYSKSQI